MEIQAELRLDHEVRDHTWSEEALGGALLQAIESRQGKLRLESMLHRCFRLIDLMQ